EVPLEIELPVHKGVRDGEGVERGDRVETARADRPQDELRFPAAEIDGVAVGRNEAERLAVDLPAGQATQRRDGAFARGAAQAAGGRRLRRPALGGLAR